MDSEEFPEIDPSEMRAALKQMENVKAPGEDRCANEPRLKEDL